MMGHGAGVGNRGKFLVSVEPNGGLMDNRASLLAGSRTKEFPRLNYRKGALLVPWADKSHDTWLKSYRTLG
jgi:hypothetical protein